MTHVIKTLKTDSQNKNQPKSHVTYLSHTYIKTGTINNSVSFCHISTARMLLPFGETRRHMPEFFLSVNPSIFPNIDHDVFIGTKTNVPFLASLYLFDQAEVQSFSPFFCLGITVLALNYYTIAISIKNWFGKEIPQQNIKTYFQVKNNGCIIL
jgi:hypothetical protein